MVVGYHYGKLPHEMRRITVDDLVLLEEFHKMYLFDCEKDDLRIQKLCQIVCFYSLGATEKIKNKINELFSFNWGKLYKEYQRLLKRKKDGKSRPDGMSIDTWARRRKYGPKGWFKIPGKED